mgnify:CR=1 FL=1
MACLYEVPLALEKEGLAKGTLEKLGLPNPEPDLTAWTEMVQRVKSPKHRLKVGLAGKYTGLSDAYLSVIESLKHASAASWSCRHGTTTMDATSWISRPVPVHLPDLLLRLHAARTRSRASPAASCAGSSSSRAFGW